MALLLVVDDDPSILRAVSRLLESEGHTVRAATGGELALRLAEEPALAVIDVMMPGMNGIELAHRLRERQPQLPIIFLTGAPALVDMKQFDNAVLVAKPWRVTSFLDTVSGLLRSAPP
jgi:CheY-like chemotaxis protein